MISYLRPGEDIKTSNPSRSVTSAKDFIAVQERLAGAGMGISYELMSRDFSGATFSSARQGHLEDRRTFEPAQQYIIEHFCRPVWAEFVRCCVLKGLVNISDFSSREAIYTAADWVPPGWQWIDPVKEVNADMTAMSAGGLTLAQWCAERGYDWREQLEQMAIEKDYAESLGLKLPEHTPESVLAAEANHFAKEAENEE